MKCDGWCEVRSDQETENYREKPWMWNLTPLIDNQKTPGGGVHPEQATSLDQKVDMKMDNLTHSHSHLLAM